MRILSHLQFVAVLFTFDNAKINKNLLTEVFFGGAARLRVFLEGIESARSFCLFIVRMRTTSRIYKTATHQTGDNWAIIKLR